ncbi:MAG: sulfatase-like hydrolase/transferase [bacterium]|nr:sulfatase-like hydrolase/transferase [bacterium]
MKKPLSTAKHCYYNIIVVFFPCAVFSIILFLGYRYEIFRLINSIYKELNILGLSDYLGLTLYYDTIALLISLVILLVILTAANRFLKIKYILIVLFFMVQLLFLLSAVDFFRVYETTFQLSFWGDEFNTGFSNIFQSYLAEVSTGFYIKLISITPVILGTALVFYLWNRKENFSRIVISNRTAPITRFLIYFPPVLMLILFFISIPSNSESRFEKAVKNFPGMEEKSLLSTLHELSMNPVYNLFAGQQEKTALAALPAENSTKDVPFSFKLDTSSLEKPLRHPRISNIPRGKKYNIILYFFESTPTKYLDIKINDKYVTPTLHRLAANSLYAKNHYANFPLSANAMLSILSSSYEHNTKDLVIQQHPDIKLLTIPEILKKQGYRTSLIHTGGLRYAGQRRFLKNRKFDQIIEYNDLIKIPPYNYHVGWGVDERAMIKPGIDFIKKDRNKPFFITYLPVNPHHPYKIPHKKYQITGKIPANLDYKKRNWLNYLNSLHYADAALGELVDALEKEGLMENTLFFLFSDHGEAFYQHRKNYNHPFYIYEENVHVPFMIYSKQFFKKRLDYTAVTRHIDILPTIQDILDIPARKEQEGKSILAAGNEQLALLHTFWKDDFLGIRDGKWKYIRRMKDGFEELYDLTKDPDEKQNLASGHKEITARYGAYIQKAKIYKTNYYKKILR